MKKIILSLALLSAFSQLPGNTLAEESAPEIKVASKPSLVTVFLTGAELRHTAPVTVQKGKSLVIFTGLSSKLDPGSIIVDIEKKNIAILSVYSTNNFLTVVPDNPKTKPIRDSIAFTEDALAEIKGKIESLTKEKELMYKNDAIFGKEKGLPASEVEKSADFFRKRTMEINTDLYKLSKAETTLTLRLGLLMKQLNELNSKINPPSSEVSVLVLAGENITSTFELKYRVADAGWEPKYDIRVESINKPVDLFYRANIFNNTGVDWVDVKLKLSTADPMQGAQYPKMEQWNLVTGGYNAQQGAYQQSQMKQLKEQNKKVDFKTVEVDELSAEFDIEQPYSIPSDSKPYLVDVNNKSLSAKYEYISVPKMDKDAFLVAKVVGWNELNLVSGNASVYFNGTYIGQSKISVVEISDTLELSLGRDSKVAIARVKKSEVNQHQIIGNYEKEVFKYEITVKNNRDIPVNITIRDQVPLENDSRISISFSELSDGVYNKSNGEVSWNLTLQPGETKKITFNFSVKYPKEFAAKKKKFRTVSAPSF
ncbi:MAG: DUF4139 domain-containing protein [Bacteroidota bacterium]